MDLTSSLAPRLLALLVVLLQGLLVAGVLSAGEKEGGGRKFRVYIGTYTRGSDSRGIYRAEFDDATGTLTIPVLAGETVNPSFVAIDPTQRYLYAVSEVETSEGKPAGALAAFAIDPSTGDLRFLNHQPTGGAGPCHVALDRQARHALTAHYGSGNAAVLAIDSQGRLGERTAFVQHHGSSVNHQRQEKPHAHSINLDPAGRFAFVADLGTDKVMIYRYDESAGTLTPNDPPGVDVAPGSGPRHFAFHPDGRHAYLINELLQTITAFDYDPAAGVLKTIGTVSTVDAPVPGNGTAEVVVHPAGRFVYGSNRGDDSIAIFAVDPSRFTLEPRGHARQGIKIPRNFAIAPGGNHLIVANQDGNSLVVFRIDQQTGGLTPTGSPVAVPRPVCVRFTNLE